jgi:hypothetical protein
VRTVYPVGTTIYQPERCANGYTLIFGRPISVIDMNGRVVNTWELDNSVNTHGTGRVHLLEDGHILVQRGGMTATDGSIDEYDWDGRLVWRYIPEGKIPHERLMGPHHDVWRKNNGNTLVICREPVPEEYLKEVREPTWQNQTICGDTILEVDREGKVVWEWNSHGHLDINHYRILASPNWQA